MRTISYAEAIREAFAQILTQNPAAFVIGQGVWSPWYVGASMTDLDKEFGRERIIDTPVAENGMMGVAVGAALAGLRPIVVHPRMDFAVLAMDQIVNEAANWHYMCGGKTAVPVVIRAMINRGGQQAAQHSQALHAWFMHTPGIKVVMPSTPWDAKGLLIAAVNDGNPVMYVDDRWLYGEIGEVPDGPYAVPIGKGIIRRSGSDVTVVSVSYLAAESVKAADALAMDRISVEVIDLRSLKPWDTEMVLRSVNKTGRLVVADGGWLTCGAAAEIAAWVGKEAFGSLKAPIQRVALPDCPAPMSGPLETVYYRTAKDIESAIRSVIDY